jgi:hypothetical protein
MSADGRLRIWLSERAARLVQEAATDALPDETGGVLIGVSVDDRPWITDAILIPSQKSSPVYYELPGEARHAAVDGARDRDRRLGYIGEWHSHTYDIGPSHMDRTTMARLAEHGGDCTEPVLLIARLRGGAHILEAHQQVGRLLKPLHASATGPLPAERDESDEKEATDG